MNKKLETLEELRATKEEMTIAQYCAEYLEEQDVFDSHIQMMMVYKNGIYIEQVECGYQLVFYNDYLFSPNLSDVEEYLWNTYREECI